MLLAIFVKVSFRMFQKIDQECLNSIRSSSCLPLECFLFCVALSPLDLGSCWRALPEQRVVQSKLRISCSGFVSGLLRSAGAYQIADGGGF